MERHEVVVVGAGPAGLTAARVLAENGKDVFVLEKLPEGRIGENVCTGAISSKSRDILNLPENMYDIKPDEWDLIFYLPKRDIKLSNSLLSDNGRYKTGYVSRMALGQWMLKNAKDAGVNVEPECAIKEVKKEENKVILQDGREFGYDALIGADGSNSVIRRSLRLKTEGILGCSYKVEGNYRDVEAFVDWKRFGLAVPFIFPHRKYGYFGIWSYDDYFVPFKEEIKRFDELCEEKYGVRPSANPGGAHLISTRYEGRKFGNIYLVGDAGGFADYVYGEGIYFALKSGELTGRELSGMDVRKEWKEFMWQKKQHNCIEIPLKIYKKAIPKSILKFGMDIVAEAGYKLFPPFSKLAMRVFFSQFVWR